MNILDKFHHWRRKQRWNKQYKKGRWDSLQSEKEAKRYHQIIDYLKEYAPQTPTILDIGCGDGVLNQRMGDYEFSYFLGLDFSKESIKKAIAKEFRNSEFITADIIGYTPSRNFDVIVFNEAFYYIHDSEKEKVLNQMLDHLNPNGLIITSIYREGTGCWEYFKENTKLTELDFTTVTTDEELRYWKIGAYRKN
ncbi:class I SAM-dependent methyltransferase [Constantimarinum furrinae]|uniref:SAM-dependent methyltransferase n=1 Tax=Constantimarinum furrinae TaxID=2562285 RepID=A0A7G8PVJ5_9FLAO|nr:class I SAM-dependent methyltransferase [Constantimarinum furrinae]QNJ98361.1 SAM-dependent methyltransferase [Constantimarinum furrinae]